MRRMSLVGHPNIRRGQRRGGHGGTHTWCHRLVGDAEQGSWERQAERRGPRVHASAQNALNHDHARNFAVRD
jgi:hypothetical protein